MKYIYLIIISILVANCNPTNRENKSISESVVDLRDSLKIETQKYQLINTLDTTIILNGGIKVYIPKNVFVDSNGNKVDSVDIHFLECVTMESMIIEKLTTTSDSLLLISNGMLKINAYKGKESLRLSKDKELKVFFPKNNTLDDYKLFYGEEYTIDESINWKLSKQNFQFNPKARIKRNYIYKFSFTGYALSIRDNKGKKFIPTYKFKDKQIPDNFFEYFDKYFKPSKEAMQWFVDNHTLINSPSDSCGLKIKIYYDNKNFNIDSITYSNESESFTSELDSFLKDMPLVEYNTFRDFDIRYNKPYMDFTIHSKKELDKSDFQSQIETKRIDEEISSEDVNYYVYSVSNLGWINCDRFYEYSNTFDLNISQKNNNGLQYNLVFKNFNSILKPDKDSSVVKFSKIPTDEAVILIGFKFKGDSVLYLRDEFFTSSNEIEIEDPKPISFIDFKEELKGLNN